MSVKIIGSAESIKAVLSGEIDHHTAKDIREKIDASIMDIQPQELILDFSQVTFMDSSGIGLVMGRFKVMKEIEGKVIVEGAAQQIIKVMKLSGLDRIATIKN
jgi:stage II sporulation protein AA (anti-sigma F factor antagonist)